MPHLKTRNWKWVFLFSIVLFLGEKACGQKNVFKSNFSYILFFYILEYLRSRVVVSGAVELFRLGLLQSPTKGGYLRNIWRIAQPKMRGFRIYTGHICKFEEEEENILQMSHAICHMSHVIYHLSHVIFPMSHVTPRGQIHTNTQTHKHKKTETQKWTLLPIDWIPEPYVSKKWHMQWYLSPKKLW